MNACHLIPQYAKLYAVRNFSLSLLHTKIYTYKIKIDEIYAAKIYIDKFFWIKSVPNMSEKNEEIRYTYFETKL